jgi:hypothetical protein
MQILARVRYCVAGLCLGLLVVLTACGGGSGSSSSPSTPPAITTQPASTTVSTGQTATLSVAATGSGTLNYQWYKGSAGDTTNPLGSDSANYSSPPLSASTNFWVQVTNSAGSANSSTAFITVVAPPPGAVPSTLFGMSMNGGIISQQPWPTVPFGGVRLWDAGVSWYDLTTAGPRQYDWSKLDEWFALIPQHNADILYTFGRIPSWASSNPNDQNCGFAPGACDPPSDLKSDGSGTDQFFKDFVTDLVSHSVQSAAGQIHYWEIINEAGQPNQWTGNVAQTVRMTLDAIQIIRAADPTAVIVSPSIVVQSSDGQAFFQGYFSTLHSQGGDVDAIAVHGYVQRSGEPLEPENLITYLDQVRNILAANNEASKPIFDTESSWGDPSVSSPAFTDPDMQAGYVARSYLIHWSEGMARFYWYQWNNDLRGTLWIPDPNNPAAPGTVLPPGIAYGQVYNWIVGSVMSSPGCTSSGSVWACPFTRTGGYQALAVWDAAQSCNNGTCTTSNFNFPSQYVHYRDLAGNTTALSGSTVPIGAKPILLENQ